MSAATIHANMRASVRQRLQTVDGLPAVAWEGKEYAPKLGTPYIAETLLPISSEPRALGLGGTIAHRMSAAFVLHYPANKGTKDIDAMAGALMEKFRPGTTLVYGNETGVVLKAERKAPEQAPDWITLPVVVSLVAYTMN